MVVIVSCDKNTSVTGVTLNKPNLTLGVCETETLVATVLPEKAANKTVTWTSSNVLVASVMPNGLVTALSKGTTTIVVTTVDGSFFASCTVKVDEIPVTGVSLNKNSLVLDIDETETLIATVFPENATIKEVYYTINNPAVAIVGGFNGTITPIGLGKATITVTTLDGSKTDKCELEVIRRVSVTGVTLKETKINLGVGTTKQLEVRITPYYATNQNVSWHSSNPLIASVDEDGLVSAKAEGTVDITVTTEDGGFTATCEVNCINFTSPVLTTLEPTNITYDTWGYSASATFRGDISNIGNPAYFERGFVYSSYYDPIAWGEGNPYDPPRYVSVSGSGTGQFSRNLSGGCPLFVRAYAKTTLGITYGNVVFIPRED
jgi:uncharacterized protein YjdB